MRVIDAARFSRLMKGRLEFYAEAPPHFDSTWPIANELKTLNGLATIDVRVLPLQSLHGTDQTAPELAAASRKNVSAPMRESPWPAAT
jgi:hypothetical protein